MTRHPAKILLVTALYLTLCAAPIASAAAQIQMPDPKNAEREKIEQIVRDYLLANPELILEVMNRLEAKQQAERDEAIKANLASAHSKLYEDPDLPTLGNADGTTVIVEFSDYNCPYCKRMAPTVKDALAKHSDLKVVMIEYPILGPGSVYAAKAALAAKFQGKYREAHLGLFAHKGSLNAGAVDRVMSKLGLDMAKLKRDMNRPEIELALTQNLQLGQTLGIQGTPAFIGGEQIRPGAISPAELAELVKVANPNE